jgi:hypothetical protein
VSIARLLALTSLFSLSLACQSALAASGGGAPDYRSAGIYPPAARPVEVKVATATTDNLAYLLEELSSATGVAVIIEEQSRNMLAKMRTGLLHDLTIPPAEVWPWIEGVFLHYGFSFGALSTRAPYLVGVYGPGSPGQFTHRVSLRVPEAELEAFHEHPGFRIRTTLELPYTDVRQLGNSLRAMTTDPTGSQAVIPVGNTNSVILEGTAFEILQLAAMLREVDELSHKALETAGAGARDAVPPPPPATER